MRSIFLAVAPSARRYLLSSSITSELNSGIGFADLFLRCPVRAISVSAFLSSFTQNHIPHVIFLVLAPSARRHLLSSSIASALNADIGSAAFFLLSSIVRHGMPFVPFGVSSLHPPSLADRKRRLSV